MYFKIMLRNGDVFSINTSSERAEKDFSLLLDRMYYLIPLALHSREQWETILREEAFLDLGNPLSLRELLDLLLPDLVSQYVYGATEELVFPSTLKESSK